MKKITTMLFLMLCLTLTAQDKIYVHTATAANISGHITYINHPDLNGNPDAAIVYKHVFNSNGGAGLVNDNIDGLWYDGAQWAIFNEDNATPMVDGAQFNIYIADDPTTVITHVADVASQGSAPYYTEIDDPSFNGNNPGPFAIMSNYWNPDGVYNNFNYGFWYDTGSNRRVIYNQSSAAIPENAAFKVLVNGLGVTRYTHNSDGANTTDYYTVLDHAELNGNPNATFVYSHYFGVSGVPSQVLNDNTLSVWYDTGSGTWRLYNESINPMPVGIAIDIIIAPQEILANNDFALENDLVMYPNPTSNTTTVSSSQEISNIRIFNILGQEVQNIPGNGITMILDVSTLQVGTYFVKIESENSTDTIKLIKQ